LDQRFACLIGLDCRHRLTLPVPSAAKAIAGTTKGIRAAGMARLILEASIFMD
jgi:hypothetical protein